jgi:hypothetical protein
MGGRLANTFIMFCCNSQGMGTWWWRAMVLKGDYERLAVLISFEVLSLLFSVLITGRNSSFLVSSIWVWEHFAVSVDSPDQTNGEALNEEGFVEEAWCNSGITGCVAFVMTS